MNNSSPLQDGDIVYVAEYDMFCEVFEIRRHERKSIRIFGMKPSGNTGWTTLTGWFRPQDLEYIAHRLGK